MEQDSCIYENDISFDSTTATFKASTSPTLLYGAGLYGAGLYGYSIQASYITSEFIDDNRILMLYSSSSTVAISLLTYNSGSGIWEVTTNQNLNEKVNLNQYIQIIKYSTNKMLIAYKWNTSNIGKISIIDTTNDIITETSSFIFTYNTVDNISLSTFDSYVLVTYINNDNTSNCGILKLLSIDSNYNITNVENSEFVYDVGNTNIYYTKTINIDEERTIISYIDNNTNHVLRIIQKDNDNNISITNKIYTGGNTSSNVNTITKLDTTKFIITFDDGDFKFAIVDINGNQIIQSNSYTYSSNINYVSTYKAYSTSSKENVYWFISVLNISSTTYATAFMVEKQKIYKGGSDAVLSQHSYLSCLVNSSNIGFYAYQDPSTNYGYFRKLDNIVITSNKQPRFFWWETNITKMLSHFNNDLEGGNISGEILSWKLTRKEKNTFLYETINIFSGDTTEYIDNKVKNNIEYTYLLSSIDSNGNQSSGVSATGTIDFSGWMISDSTEYYNLSIGWDGYQTSGIKTNKGNYKFDNLTQFPVISYSQQKYRTGSITCIPYSYNITNNNFDINLEVLNNFKTFLDNGNTKWLRSQDGDIMKVSTINTDYKYQDKIIEQLFQVNFEWCEIGSV